MKVASIIESWSISRVDIARAIPMALLYNWTAILCLFVIAVLLNIDSGKDISVGILDLSSPALVFLRAGMIFLGLIIYCSSIWLRPTVFFKKNHYESSFTRVLAVLPCFLLGMSIFRTQFSLSLLSAFNIYWGLFLLMLLLFLSILFRERIYDYVNIKQTIFVFLITIIALITGIYVNKAHGFEEVVLSYHLFGIACGVLGVGLFHLFKKIDKDLKGELQLLQKNYLRYYYFIVLITGVFIAVFTYFDHINIFHPIFVFFISFSFYIIIFNSINTLYDRNNFRKIIFKNLLIFSFAIVLFLGFSYPNFDHHKVDLVELQNSYERSTIEEHFESYKNNTILPWLEDHPEEKFPLYLVAGEGGGSRAGYWFTQTILGIDAMNDYRFKQHIYAMSTVSGSSVGAGALLAFWEEFKDQDKQAKDLISADYAENIFSQNYLSSSIFSVLIRDFIKQLFPLRHWVGDEDRNYWLQQEEAHFIDQALNNEAYDFADYVSNYSYPKKRSKEYLLYRPYLEFYYDQNGDLRNDHPILLTNTTLVQRGVRGIVSPIKFKENHLVDAFDINGFIHSHSPNEGLSLGEACNLSELFPFFSATAILGDSVAIADGGYFENLGLTALYELRNTLNDLIEVDNNPLLQEAIEIKFLVVRNSTYQQKRNRELKVRNQIYSPLDAIYNSGIGGRTEYMFKYLQNQMGENFRVISLNHTNNKNEKLLLPINRYLSENAVTTMNKLWEQEEVEDLIIY